MYSKFIKSHQWSLERSHAVFWLKLILNSDQDLTLSRQKQIHTGLLVTKVYKNRTMKIFLFDYSMLGYILPITTSLCHKFSSNPYLETHTPDWTSSIIPPRNISDKFTIIWDLCRFLQPSLICSTIFCKNLDFPTVNHNRSIKLHWAQFPMIGNTWNWNFSKILYKNFPLQQ